jgi:hypothetical protein
VDLYVASSAEAIVGNTEAVSSTILYHPALKILGSVNGVAKDDVLSAKLAGGAIVRARRVVADLMESDGRYGRRLEYERDQKRENETTGRIA